MPGIMVEERKSRLQNVCCRSVFMRASIMPGHNAHNHLLAKGTRKSTMNLLSYIIIININAICWRSKAMKVRESWKWCLRAIVILHRRQKPDSPNIGNTLQMTHREREREVADQHKNTRTVQNWIWTWRRETVHQSLIFPLVSNNILFDRVCIASRYKHLRIKLYSPIMQKNDK